MGTTSYIGFKINGKYKVTYSHFDGYTSGVGATIFSYVKNHTLKHMKSIAESITLVDIDSTPTVKQIKECEPWVNLQVSEQSVTSWYCLTREAQGDLIAYSNGLKYMPDYSDQMFTTYCYIINLDEKVLECSNGEIDSDTSEPLIAKIPISKIRKMSENSFIKEVDVQLEALFSASEAKEAEKAKKKVVKRSKVSKKKTKVKSDKEQDVIKRPSLYVVKNIYNIDAFGYLIDTFSKLFGASIIKDVDINKCTFTKTKEYIMGLIVETIEVVQEEIALIYEKCFTDEELLTIIDFYNTETGKKFVDFNKNNFKSVDEAIYEYIHSIFDGNVDQIVSLMQSDSSDVIKPEESIVEKRRRFAMMYIKKKEWDLNNLTVEQIREIRECEEWKNPY